MRYLIFLLPVIFFSCGNSKTPEAPAKPIGEQRAAIEARLVNELSPESTRAGKERNAIINYAIDELWDVQAAPEGYFYEITNPGQGMEAMMWDGVKLHYQGRYLDGKIFDDSRRRNEKLSFKVGQMIPAWNYALQHLSPGGSMRLIVPSELAYGADGLVSAKGDTIVGAHQILIFELDGLEITERRLEHEW